MPTEQINPLNLNDAIAFLKKKQCEVINNSDFGWRKVYHATQHLEKQVEAYFAPEEIVEVA